jgi:hypothetical protein
MVFMILIGMPVLILALSLAWRYATGPFWLGTNSDPSYQYLINSLYLAEHRVPLYFQHPGTTVQALGAVIIKAFNAFVPNSLMVEHVLRDPEFYLHAMYAALIIFYTATLAALSIAAYRRSRDLTFAFLIQASAFLYLTMCKEEGFTHVLANMCPETLLIGLINLYGLCLLRAFFVEDNKSMLLTSLGWGVVYGLMLGTKFTCLALVVIPLVLLSTFRNRLFFCLAALAAFVLATSPVWSRYQAMWGNLYGMLTHTGFRGNGQQGFIAWESFRDGLTQTFVQQWLLLGSVILALIFVLYHWIIQGQGKKLNKAYSWAVWTGITIMLQYVIVAKETTYHYMIPAAGLFGFFVALMYLGHAVKQRIWQAGMLFFIALSLISSLMDMKNFYTSSMVMQNFSKEVYKHQEGVLCGFYRNSSIPFSLAFGDICYGLKAYADVRQRLYPNQYVMDITQYKIDEPQGTYVEDLLAQNQNVYLYGSALAETSFSPMLKVKMIEQSGSEAMYKVLGANDKKAAQMYYMAEMALSQGQGQIAYMLAQHAKALGMPVARDLVAEMDRMIAKKESQ